MPARITVRAELASLLAKSQSLTDANRLQQLDAESRRRAELAQLAAKKKKADAEATRKKQLDDPIGRGLKPAAMGKPGVFADYPGFYVIYQTDNTYAVKVRSGVLATVTDGLFETVADSTYANQVNVQSIPMVPLPPYTGPLDQRLACPQYAAVWAEIQAGPFLDRNIGGEGWERFFSGAGNQDNWQYLKEGLPNTYQRTKYVSFQDFTASGGGTVGFPQSYRFSTPTGPNGVPILANRIRFYTGFKWTRSVEPITFGGYIVYTTFDFTTGVTLTDDRIVCTGGIEGRGPVTNQFYGGWEVAINRRIPAASSVTFIGTAGLPVEDFLAGDFSAFPNATPAGLMTALFPGDPSIT